MTEHERANRKKRTGKVIVWEIMMGEFGKVGDCVDFDVLF
jgi:hypothetical protein